MNIKINNIKLKLKENKEVFSPGKVSLLLGKIIRINKGDFACDLGTGTGIFAILASKLGAKKVYASDINPKAVDLAKENSIFNNCDNILIKKGSLFEPFPKIKFDVIISNPPQENRKLTNSLISKALSSGNEYPDLRKEVLLLSNKKLRKNGRLYFLLIKWQDYKKIEQIINKLYETKKKIEKKIYKKDYSKSFQKYLKENKDKYSKEVQESLDIVFYELSLKAKKKP